ncbi:NblA/ycf18 family protein [Oscillatoriales cyanobacterium LEGE 11467]|uniref:NblA/ycf18 family protein n=1 Tax=Zarconia navalis LEGE 11467 TaxID=1828826 RepID=A0A928VYY7_9CYAN|nr:NblA/ycf18 family protein [Zarconia navalis]MBE9042194.1 NblA/ycf18 family protein [Zarconia navalis LEGE 11467]
MESSGQLTLEQQFQLRILQQSIEKLSAEQARDFLLEAFRQMMVKDNFAKQMFKDCYL